MAPPLTGSYFIGSKRVQTPDRFYAINPETSDKIEPGFSVSTEKDVERACALANSIFDRYRATNSEDRAQFLEAIAENVGALGDTAILRAQSETALPQARLTGELARTCNQLRLFASELRDGRWQGLRRDPAQPDRKPLPRPDLRMRKIPLGPVAVFGASNFPFAFSVAGGDTAAALAAGCPVVVKAHPAHPGASELVAGAIIEAVKTCGLPDGVFSMVAGPSNALGASLVANPHIKAVGFTGSRQAGLALMEIAARRAEPIPVYAEMSSINPVLLLPAALERRAEALAETFLNSLTMGVGQFCTNPGLLIALQGPGLERFISAAATRIAHIPAATMLTPGIFANYSAGVARLRDDPHTRSVGGGAVSRGPNCGQAFLFSVSATDFLASPKWAQEVFGPSSVVVRCESQQQMRAVLETLEGQLTATVQVDDADHSFAQDILPILERKAGRILANGWPTGVEVAHAMVHGGPFPATSDGRSTSVGTLAIDRFLRPVCYQDLPSDLLPAAVRAL